MKKLCVIGEALIDFVPVDKGVMLKDVSGFQKKVGGAPINVSVAYQKLGGHSLVLTQLGQDAFGDQIVETLQNNHVDISHILRSKDYETSLAFVSLKADGDREFQFYRKNAADLYYDPSNITNALINEIDAVHFCSVSLVDSLMKKAHDRLIELSIQNNKIICFDPNLRFALWDDHQQLKQTVNEYLTYADIIKISEDELEFITGKTCIDDALDLLFKNRCQLIVFTKGSQGAELITRSKRVFVQGLKVNVLDTTGAGDSFIGALLYQLLNSETSIDCMTQEQLQQYLNFANYYGAYTTTGLGAIESMASIEEINSFIYSKES